MASLEYDEHVLRCTAEGCPGIRKMGFHSGMGIKVGDILKEDPTDPTRYQCPFCKRHNMRVISGPPTRPPTAPKGFTKLPKE